MYLLLFFFWIILNGRLTVEIVLLGMLFAAIVYGFAWKFMGLTLEREKSFWKHFGWGIQYLAILMKEIAAANITVLKIVLSPKKKIHPVIVSFDAPLKNHILQVILADSITLTPGTITVSLTEQELLVHCLDKTLAEGMEDSSFVKLLKKLEERAA